MSKSKIQEVFGKSLVRFAGLASNLNIFAKSTEEIQDDIKQGRDRQTLFAAGRNMLAHGGGAKARLEENYLFDTRRFAAGALGAGDYQYFASAIGQPGTNNGFVAPMVMSEVETNMDVPSQVPQGKDFVMTQVGLSFNSNALASDIALLLEAGALRFSMQGGQYTIRHGVGRLWPGGSGINGFAGAAATAVAASNGSADIRAVRRLQVPRVLPAKATFAYIYYVPRAVSNLDNSTAITLTNPTLMTVWLWGAQRDSIPV
jgi:hypothetical protein